MRPKLLALIVGLVALLAACAPGNPWPPFAPPPPAQPHHTVLLLGDSLMVGVHLFGSLEGQLSAHGYTNVAVESVAASGTNLIDNYGYLTPTQWAQVAIDAHPEADVVAVEYIGTCANTCTSGALAYGGSVFYAIWSQRARQIVDYALSAGRHVLWVTSPPIAPGTTSVPNASPTLLLNPTVVQALAYNDATDYGPRAGLSADWQTALTDTSYAYEAQLTYDGGDHTVRGTDGVHFVADGATRAGAWLLAGLQAALQ